MGFDDSLYLGYVDGQPAGAAEAALPIEAWQRFLTCPHQFYLHHIEGLESPPTFPEVQEEAFRRGLAAFHDHRQESMDTAVEAASQALVALLEERWEAIEEPVIHVNADDPTQPQGRVPHEATLERTSDTGQRLLRWICSQYGAAPGTLFHLDPAQHDVPLGALARAADLPHAEMTVADPETRGYRNLPVPIVAGVPIHGTADALLTWPDGSPMLLATRAVSSLVPFWGSERQRLAARYDPVHDFVLDLWTIATGVPRVGYQVICTLPQYVPEDGVLHPAWREEAAWQQAADAYQHLPMNWARDSKGQARFIAVWRPAPPDHPSEPQQFTRAQVFARAARILRTSAQLITEGVLLLQDGVAPEVAFPPGRASKIGRKVCPFCSYADAVCFVPQRYETDEERAALEAAAEARRKEREEQCQANAAITERRTLWTDVQATLRKQQARTVWGG